MSATTTMTVRLPHRTKKRLEDLARSTDRSKTYLASRAIEEFLDAQEWQVRAIEEAVKEADAPDASFLDHEEVARGLRRPPGTAKKEGAR